MRVIAGKVGVLRRPDARQLRCVRRPLGLFFIDLVLKLLLLILRGGFQIALQVSYLGIQRGDFSFFRLLLPQQVLPARIALQAFRSAFQRLIIGILRRLQGILGIGDILLQRLFIAADLPEGGFGGLP